MLGIIKKPAQLYGIGQRKRNEQEVCEAFNHGAKKKQVSILKRDLNHKSWECYFYWLNTRVG